MTPDQREDKIGELLRDLTEQQEQLAKMQCMIASHYASINGLESDRVWKLSEKWKQSLWPCETSMQPTTAR